MARIFVDCPFGCAWFTVLCRRVKAGAGLCRPHFFCPSADDSVPAEREPGEVVDSLVGKQVEYAKEDGGKRTGMVIHQVEAKPSVYFIKFDDDFLIYVYDLVKTS